MGVKRPEEGSKWRFFGEYVTWTISAQLKLQYTVRPKVASHESQERNRRNFSLISNLRRKPSSPNFCQKPENVAFRSILTLAGWGVLYPARRGIVIGARRSWGIGRES